MWHPHCEIQSQFPIRCVFSAVFTSYPNITLPSSSAKKTGNKNIKISNWGLCIDTLIIKNSLKEKLNDFTMNIMSFTWKLLFISYYYFLSTRQTTNKHKVNSKERHEGFPPARPDL